MKRTIWEVTQRILDDADIDIVTKEYVAEKRMNMLVEAGSKEATKDSVMEALGDVNNDFIFVVELEEAIKKAL